MSKRGGSSKHFLGLSLNDLLCSELHDAGPLNSVVNPEAVRKSERATRGVSHRAERRLMSRVTILAIDIVLRVVIVEVWLKSIENQQESKSVPE